MFDTVAQDILHNCSSHRTRYNPCITGATYMYYMYMLMYMDFNSARLHKGAFLIVISDEMLQTEYTGQQSCNNQKKQHNVFTRKTQSLISRLGYVF